MGVETIHDEMNFGGHRCWAEEGSEMSVYISLGAGVPDAGLVELTRRDIQRGDQGLGAMANVLKLHLFTAPRLHVQIGHGSFQGLNAGHLVETIRQFTALSPLGGLLVDLADVGDFGGELNIGGG